VNATQIDDDADFNRVAVVDGFFGKRRCPVALAEHRNLQLDAELGLDATDHSLAVTHDNQIPASGSAMDGRPGWRSASVRLS
jgi:hypothetical protein